MSVFKILTNEEEKDFELVPKFDSLSQNHFFKLTSGVSESISEMKSDSNKILFILMFGYFKATHRFFEIQKNDENYLYIANRNNLNIFDFNTVTSRTQQRYKQIIKSYFNVNEYKSIKVLHYIYGKKYRDIFKKNIYDKVISFNIEEVISQVLFNLNKSQENFEFHCVEDGPGGYEVYKPEQYKWSHIYRWLGIEKHYYNIKTWWTGCPVYM